MKFSSWFSWQSFSPSNVKLRLTFLIALLSSLAFGVERRTPREPAGCLAKGQNLEISKLGLPIESASQANYLPGSRLDRARLQELDKKASEALSLLGRGAHKSAFRSVLVRLAALQNDELLYTL